MRAFWPDERVESAAWPQSNPFHRAIFRYFKSRQRELLEEAGRLVTLSEDGRRAIAEMKVRGADKPVTVRSLLRGFRVVRSARASRVRQSALGPRARGGRSAARPCRIDRRQLAGGGDGRFLPGIRERRPAAHFLFVAPSGEGGHPREAGRRVDQAVLFRSAGRDGRPALDRRGRPRDHVRSPELGQARSFTDQAWRNARRGPAGDRQFGSSATWPKSSIDRAAGVAVQAFDESGLSRRDR